mmetsp:Transcript_20445/g.37277  ORF Transcript_20445/g.37277 Transcript_20445/m.37277 type:complete len:404 (+) Transcript_20445:75-1286(+)
MGTDDVTVKIPEAKVAEPEPLEVDPSKGKDASPVTSSGVTQPTASGSHSPSGCTKVAQPKAVDADVTLQDAKGAASPTPTDATPTVAATAPATSPTNGKTADAAEAPPAEDAAKASPEEERPPPEALQPQAMIALHLMGDSLELLMAPGDILIFRGSGSLLEIGTIHGFMGHTMLVLSPPVAVHRGTPEAAPFEPYWPSDSIQELWLARTLESTREAKGLFEVDCLMYVDRQTRQLTVMAEVQKVGEGIKVTPTAHESVSLYQSPAEYRIHLRLDIMQRVVQEMRKYDAAWSLTTGIRAVLSSAHLSSSTDLKKVKEAWREEPICTSVVITFWQRYICHIAAIHGEAQRDERAMKAILRVMPLFADRGLPKDLIAAFDACGWVKVSNIPHTFRPLVVPTSTMV